MEDAVAVEPHLLLGLLSQLAVSVKHAGRVELGGDDHIKPVQEELDGLVVKISGQVAGSRVCAVPRLPEPSGPFGIFLFLDVLLKPFDLLVDEPEYAFKFFLRPYLSRFVLRIVRLECSDTRVQGANPQAG